MFKSKSYLYLLFPLIAAVYFFLGNFGGDEGRPVINKEALKSVDMPLCADRPYVMPEFYRKKKVLMSNGDYYTYFNGSWVVIRVFAKDAKWGVNGAYTKPVFSDFILKDKENAYTCRVSEPGDVNTGALGFNTNRWWKELNKRD